MKCAACKTREAVWAWQPFGPSDRPTAVRPGSHYRGFPVVKLCNQCYFDAEDGETITFTYCKHVYSETGEGVTLVSYPCPTCEKPVKAGKICMDCFERVGRELSSVEVSA